MWVRIPQVSIVGHLRQMLITCETHLVKWHTLSRKSPNMWGLDFEPYALLDLYVRLLQSPYRFSLRALRCGEDAVACSERAAHVLSTTGADCWRTSANGHDVRNTPTHIPHGLSLIYLSVKHMQGPHRLVVRTTHRGRKNPGSIPEEDMCGMSIPRRLASPSQRNRTCANFIRPLHKTTQDQANNSRGQANVPTCNSAVCLAVLNKSNSGTVGLPPSNQLSRASPALPPTP